MRNADNYTYVFNMIFDNIVTVFEIDIGSLSENIDRAYTTIGNWRHNTTPPPRFYNMYIKPALADELAETLERYKGDLPLQIKYFKQNAINKFSRYIENIEKLLSGKDLIGCALCLLDYSLSLNETKLVSKLISDKAESIKDQAQSQISKGSSPKLDEEMIAQLKSIGANIETEEELYVMVMNLALHILEEGIDDDSAFSWLEMIYDKPDLQDNICGFAMMLYDKEDYSRAFKIFLGLAKQGHTIAQTFVGECYHYGKGVEPNLGIAYNWYAKVADIKDDESADIAQMGLVMCLLGMAHTEGSDFLLQLTITAAQKYAELGNAQVQYVLACAYRNGNGVPKNDSLAHFWMGQAAKNGLIDAIKIMKSEE